MSLAVSVLIDTWWNVNEANEFGLLGSILPGFNRYMVECEFVFANITTTVDNRFNRYMVECEFYLR